MQAAALPNFEGKVYPIIVSLVDDRHDTMIWNSVLVPTRNSLFSTHDSLRRILGGQERIEDLVSRIS